MCINEEVHHVLGQRDFKFLVCRLSEVEGIRNLGCCLLQAGKAGHSGKFDLCSTGQGPSHSPVFTTVHFLRQELQKEGAANSP